ncbi:MAG: GNAT family N-acetyltransferase, partial [Actinomycetota bacterium]|nr:GNAT family N-acetyltransferase [Actinomycetota bacterium]
MGPVLLVRIRPADVGRRVTIRCRIPAGQGQPSLTDTLGFCAPGRWGVLEVEVRDGSLARIRETDVVAARVVPSPATRRRRSGRSPAALGYA